MENDIFVMKSFVYNYKNPPVFCFLMLVKTINKIVVYSSRAYRTDHFTVAAELPGLWMEARLPVTLF